jgi:serine protease Do
MRRRLIYIFGIILSFFLGCGGMYYFISMNPLKTETIQKVMNEYKIEETAITDAIDKVYDGVVVVESFKDDRQIGSGTGFIYKTDDKYGYIMTNSHVIGEGNKMNVIFSDKKSSTATLLGKDAYADIAVLRVPISDDYIVLEIGKSEDMKLGSTVFTVGAPLGSDYSGTVTKGILSGKDRIVSVSLSSYGNNDWMMRVLQTDAAINPGNSGGPLLNLAGEVIGINSLKLVEDKVEGMGFAIPIEDAMRYVESLEKGEIITRPMLGVELIDLDEAYTLFLNGIIVDEEVESGVVISKVAEDSPADKIGLQKGDIVLKLGKATVKNKAELRYELYKHNVGDKIKITIYRDKKVKEYEVTLADSNQ